MKMEDKDTNRKRASERKKNIKRKPRAQRDGH